MGDIGCIKKHWNANERALDIVAGCEERSHGASVDMVMAKAFLGQLAAKPRPWLTSQRAAIAPVMNADDVEGTIKELIAEELGIDQEKVTMSASFTEDLDADSLDAMDLMMAIEEKFDIQIQDEEAEKMSTPGDCVAAVKEKLERVD